KGEGLLVDDGGSLSGSLQLARIMLNGQNLGGILFTAERQAEGVLFIGSHESRVLEGMNLKIKGEVGSSPVNGLYGSLHLSAPRQKFSAFNLGRFVQARQEVTLAGEIGLQAALAFSEGRKSGDLQLQLHNTRLEMPSSEVVLTGLNLSLALPDLFQTRSLPAQPLSFATAKVGNLAFSGGKFAFQIESPTSLLLESGVFAWCDGHVSTESLRLSTSRRDYEMTLVCDRLSLASLFAQFGVQRAEGEGTLNGRIPIEVVNGRLHFVDGLLSSPPGEGGNIRIGDLGLLTAGIPKESPQFSQLDFAGEALKDFRYNSAKLQFSSEGEELLLQIKLDGQPVHPIPFIYNSQLGSFTRLQVGETGGIIHPIRLDMNLRLPFEKIMEYGGGMQKLYKMTQ
ncbi:MAG: YdbH domain-containing protein, partial [Desulfobulbaceae bacterium]